MTNLSQSSLNDAHLLGSQPVPNCPAHEFRTPPAIVSALGLRLNYSWEEGEIRFLARAKHEGLLGIIPSLAERATASLEPVESTALLQRLTLLGMSMANGKDADQVRAWLHETARLLADLPRRHLFEAIDECVKEPGRAFLPSVGEIREKAAAPLQETQREAYRLNRLAKLIADGVAIPDYVPPAPAWSFAQTSEPEPICTPEEAKAILVEFGLRPDSSERLLGMLAPEKPMNNADYAAAGRMPPPAPPAADPWEMMP